MEKREKCPEPFECLGRPKALDILISEEYLNNITSYCILNVMSNEVVVEKLYEELARIRSLLEILASDKINRMLESVATTKERQVIWASLDGLSSTEEISKRIGISQRAVQLFVKELLERDLVYIEKRGFPKRKFEHVPSEWRIEQHVRGYE